MPRKLVSPEQLSQMATRSPQAVAEIVALSDAIEASEVWGLLPVHPTGILLRDSVRENLALALACDLHGAGYRKPIRGE